VLHYTADSNSTDLSSFKFVWSVPEKHTYNVIERVESFNFIDFCTNQKRVREQCCVPILHRFGDAAAACIKVENRQFCPPQFHLIQSLGVNHASYTWVNPVEFCDEPHLANTTASGPLSAGKVIVIFCIIFPICEQNQN